MFLLMNSLICFMVSIYNVFISGYMKKTGNIQMESMHFNWLMKCQIILLILNHLQCTYGTNKYFITLKMNSSIVKIVSGLINLLKTCILCQKRMNALKDMPYLQLYYSLSHALNKYKSCYHVRMCFHRRGSSRFL